VWPDSSLLCSKETATTPCTEPDNFSCLTSFQTKLSCATFRNLLDFYGHKMLVLCPAPTSEDLSLHFVRACLLNTFTTSLLIYCPSAPCLHDNTSYRNLISFIIICSLPELIGGYFHYIARQNSVFVQQSHLTKLFLLLNNHSSIFSPKNVHVQIN